MKEFFYLAFALCFLLCSCTTEKATDTTPEDNYESTVADSAETDTEESDTETVPTEKTVTAMYENALQKIIDDGEWINAIWLEDTDQDGFPTVSLCRSNVLEDTPSIFVNYRYGKIYTLKIDPPQDSSTTILDEVLLCKGTDYIVVRSTGTTIVTFHNNHQQIYAPQKDSNSYHLIYEGSIEYPDSFLDKFYEECGDNNFDNLRKYDEYRTKELNKRVFDVIGEECELISSYGSMEHFGFYESEEQSARVMATAVSHLNLELGIDLVISK